MSDDIREQLTTLRVGDIVRLHHRAWPKSAYQQGPVFPSLSKGWQCGSIPLDNWWDEIDAFEIIERAPRFYSNTDRGPVVGDLATTANFEHSSKVGPWFLTEKGWVSKNGTPILGNMPPADNILLYDGRTRRPVP